MPSIDCSWRSSQLNSADCPKFSLQRADAGFQAATPARNAPATRFRATGSPLTTRDDALQNGLGIIFLSSKLEQVDDKLETVGLNPFQEVATRMNKRLITWVLLGLAILTTGCQRQYRPASWQPAVSNENSPIGDEAELELTDADLDRFGKLTPLVGENPSGRDASVNRRALSTLPSRQTAPRSNSTLPSRTTLPSRVALPQTTLPSKSSLAPRSSNGLTLPSRSLPGTPGHATTLPSRGNSTTLPARNNLKDQRLLPRRNSSTTLPGSR